MMETIVVLIGVLIGLIILGISMIGIFKPDEMAWIMFMGKLWKFHKESPCFPVFWFLPNSGLKKITRKRFELDFEPRPMISKPGENENEKEQIKYGRQILMVGCTIHVEFKQDKESARMIIEKQVPTTEEELVKYIDGFVEGVLRLSIGGMTWGEALEDNGRKKIEETFKEATKKDNSIFKQAGFNIDTMDLKVKTIELKDKELENLLILPDKEQLKKAGVECEVERLEKQIGVLTTTRKDLREKGGFSEKIVDQIAYRAYELRTLKDLTEQRGGEPIKVIRFETDSQKGISISNLVAEAMIAYNAMRTSQIGKTKKEEEANELKDEEEETDEEEYSLREVLLQDKERFAKEKK